MRFPVRNDKSFEKVRAHTDSLPSLLLTAAFLPSVLGAEAAMAAHLQRGSVKLRDVLEEGRVIMRHRPNQQETSATEDCCFRELFGCGPKIALIV